jgi:hypothetical protein
MQKYNKAIVAVIGGVVALLAPAIPGIEDTVSPEVIQAIATIATPVFVYAIPNIEGDA